MDRVVVVTGSSSGIGLATCVAFARAGDTVVATMRDTARAGPLLEAVRAAGVSVEVAALDVTSQQSVADAVAAVLSRHGRIDVLVNNAGQGTSGTLEELSIADLQRSLEVNYLGVARTTKAVLPAMRAARHGHLIGVSSVAGAVGQPFNDAYCAAKHAMEGLYESLRPVADALGVQVCIVQPGPVLSPFHERSERIDAPDPDIARLKTRYRTATAPGTRGQPPEEVAELIVGIADDPSPALRYQTSRFTARLVERKLADLDGSRVVAMTSRWLEEPGGA